MPLLANRRRQTSRPASNRSRASATRNRHRGDRSCMLWRLRISRAASRRSSRPAWFAPPAIRVLVERLVASGVVVMRQRPRQAPHVGDGEIQALGAGRRHDVRGIAGQEQALVPHGLRDEDPHGGDAFLDYPTFVRRPAIVGSQPRAELTPDPLVRPVVERLARRALQVEARHPVRSHAEEREPCVVQAVHGFAR